MVQNMKTVIFTGGKAGPFELSRHWLDGADTIIAADSGLDLCRSWGYEPDLLCGDFDSVARLSEVESFPEDKVVRHVEAKAWSDTELALHQTEADDTVLAGGNGGRSDHFYSILNLFSHHTYPRVWLGEEQAILCLEDEMTCHLSCLQKGDKISVFAVRVESGEPGGNTNAWEGGGSRARLDRSREKGRTPKKTHTVSEYHIESDTLLWPLQDVDWSTGAESLSNWLEDGADSLCLKVTAGRFLVFVPLHAKAEYQVIQKVNGAGE